MIKRLINFLRGVKYKSCEMCSELKPENVLVNHLDIETKEGIMRLHICTECADDLDKKTIRG